MQHKRRISKIKSTWIIPIILIICDLKIYPASNTFSNSPFTRKEEQNGINKGASSLSESSGTFSKYQPFNTNNYMGSPLESNALKAPDGLPINGIPVYDSLLPIISMVIIYVIIKTNKQRSVHN